MMSDMLIEKRNEFVNKLNALEVARQNEIDAQVAAYRKSLEETAPREEIQKVANVIAALDEVIKYENSLSNAEVQSVKIETIGEKESRVTVDARPGMATVFMPSR